MHPCLSLGGRKCPASNAHSCPGLPDTALGRVEHLQVLLCSVFCVPGSFGRTWGCQTLPEAA
eukprot:4430268-Alexandrium_andersonii.AAC.1